MGRGLSGDLRDRVVAAIDDGMSCFVTARRQPRRRVAISGQGGSKRVTDLLPENHAIVNLARQMETSDAAKPIYRIADYWRAARA